MEIELYRCTGCEKVVSKPVSPYESDDPYCQQCLDRMEVEGDMAMDAQMEESMLDANN